MQETYRQINGRHEKESNAIACKPRMFCAFSDKQIEDGKAEYLAAGYEEKDLVKGTIGWFGHKDGFKDWYALLRKQAEEVKEAMQDHDFAVGAYYYEACNHEYGINWDADEETLAVFGYKNRSELDKAQRAYYEEAIRKYWHDANEGGWL